MESKIKIYQELKIKGQTLASFLVIKHGVEDIEANVKFEIFSNVPIRDTDITEMLGISRRTLKNLIAKGKITKSHVDSKGNNSVGAEDLFHYLQQIVNKGGANYSKNIALKFPPTLKNRNGLMGKVLRNPL